MATRRDGDGERLPACIGQSSPLCVRSGWNDSGPQAPMAEAHNQIFLDDRRVSASFLAEPGSSGRKGSSFIHVEGKMMRNHSDQGYDSAGSSH